MIWEKMAHFLHFKASLPIIQCIVTVNPQRVILGNEGQLRAPSPALAANLREVPLPAALSPA